MKDYRFQENKNPISCAYFSLQDSDSSSDNKTDLTNENSCRSNIKLPVFKSNSIRKHYNSHKRPRKSSEVFKKKLKIESDIQKETFQLNRNHSCNLAILSTVFNNVAKSQEINESEKLNDRVHTDQPQTTTKVIKRTVDLYNVEEFTNVKKNKVSNSLTKSSPKLQSCKTKENKQNKSCICSKSANDRSPNKSCGVYCKFLSSMEQKDLIFKKATCTSVNSFIGRHNRVLPAQWWRVWCDFVNIEYKSLQQHFDSVKTNISRNIKCSMKEALTTMKISEESDIEFDIKSIKDDKSDENKDSFINSKVLQTQNCINSELNINKLDNKNIKSIKFNTECNDMIKAKENCRNRKQLIDSPSARLSEIYSRPGKIINKKLVDFENSSIANFMLLHNDKTPNGLFELKPNLQEYYDYMLVPKDSWNMLASWYGFDYEIIYEPDIKMADSSINANY